MKALETEVSFKDALNQSREVSTKLSQTEINECLDYSTYLGVAGKLVDNAIEMTEKEQSSQQDKSA